MNDDYRVTYRFYMDMVNSGLEDHPDTTIEMSFNGTDLTLDTMVSYFENFLKSSGYVFDQLEIVNHDQ
jgi:hypothetical protein